MMVSNAKQPKLSDIVILYEPAESPEIVVLV